MGVELTGWGFPSHTQHHIGEFPGNHDMCTLSNLLIYETAGYHSVEYESYGIQRQHYIPVDQG
jgi:hypothetical protein